MNELRVSGYMTHSKIEEILDGSVDKLTLKKHLNKVRVHEMMQHIKTKKLETEIALLKAHEDQVYTRLQGLENELKKELEVPDILKQL